jgi:subtilisin family serine protease
MMIRSLLITILLLSVSPAFADATIDPALENFLNGQSLKKIEKVIVMLQVPSTDLEVPFRYDREKVIQYLQNISKIASDDLRASVLRSTVSASDIQIRDTFWINLTVSADVSIRGLLELSKTGGVVAIYSNKKIQYPMPLFFKSGETAETPYQFKHTGLDKLIQELPEIDGRGVLVGHIDTGVDGTHPALKGKISAFFDGRKVTEPSDSDVHGTHTAGTILGGDRKDILIGVAPGAKLVSAGFLRNLDEILKGMQWIMDPDQNPNTDDMPRMVSNSWRVWYNSPLEAEPLYRAVAAWEAAGIVPVFAAGNEGPREKTIGHPSQDPLAVCIGATDQAGVPASFSSRGPGIQQKKEINKPDLSAPGVQVLSSIPGGRYSKFDGTSMATPQVAGAIALLLQVNSKLTPPQIKEILKESLIVPEGKTRGVWDRAYGYGKLDIYSAVKKVMSLSRDYKIDHLFAAPFEKLAGLDQARRASPMEPVKFSFDH